MLLDGWALLGRPSLRAAEEALRRWLNAAALVRPGASGGAVTVVAEAALPAVQALIRWDPVTHADRELAEREALRFPPAVRMAALSGPGRAVAELLAAAVLPPEADVLGPIPLDGAGRGVTMNRRGPLSLKWLSRQMRTTSLSGNKSRDGVHDQQVRVLVRVPRSASMPLAAALQAAQGVRSARKDAGAVRVQLDPAELI